MLWFQAQAWGWLGGIHATWVLPDHRQGSSRVISGGGEQVGEAHAESSIHLYLPEARHQVLAW